jgi:glycosyltransferase involved in cell wall biosynthesis
MISVVIPFYNCNQYLDDALDSIQQQGGLVREVILIVDNGSEQPIIEKNYDFDVRVYANPEVENGAGVLRAYGLTWARQRFVMFLDPDDYYEPGALKAYIEEVKSKQFAFSFANYYDVDNQQSKKTPQVNKSNNTALSLAGFLRKSFTVGCLTVVIDSYQIASMKPNYFKKRNDYYAWYWVLRECEEKGYKWGMSDLFVSNHRLHDSSLTASKFDAARWQLKFLNKLPISKIEVITYFMFYIVQTVGRRLLK